MSGQGRWLQRTFQWVQKQCPVTSSTSDVLQCSVSGMHLEHFGTRNKRYFYCRREVNSSDSKSAISVVMAKALFQVFQHKLSVLPCLVRIKSSCCNSFLDFWIPVCSLGFGRRPGASWVAQEVSAAPRLGLCPAVLGQNWDPLGRDQVLPKLGGPTGGLLF